MDDTSERRPHDLGGNAAGPIDTTDHGMLFWERQMNALRRAVTANGIARVDELRRATEDLGDRYYELGYFEKAATALRTILLEKGVIDEAELQARIEDVRARYEAAASASSGQ